MLITTENRSSDNPNLFSKKLRPSEGFARPHGGYISELDVEVRFLSQPLLCSVNQARTVDLWSPLPTHKHAVVVQSPSHIWLSHGLQHARLLCPSPSPGVCLWIQKGKSLGSPLCSFFGYFNILSITKRSFAIMESTLAWKMSDMDSILSVMVPWLGKWLSHYSGFQFPHTWNKELVYTISNVPTSSNTQ